MEKEMGLVVHAIPMKPATLAELKVVESVSAASISRCRAGPRRRPGESSGDSDVTRACEIEEKHGETVRLSSSKIILEGPRIALAGSRKVAKKCAALSPSRRKSKSPPASAPRRHAGLHGLHPRAGTCESL